MLLSVALAVVSDHANENRHLAVREVNGSCRVPEYMNFAVASTCSLAAAGSRST
jgi:hypothetical protein